MIKVWILILTTAGPGEVPSKTQDIPMFDERSCRSNEREPHVGSTGVYWSARCKWILVPKPKEKK